MKLKIGPRTSLGLLAFLFAGPVLSGVLQRFARGTPWFGDFEAMACAGVRVLKGEAIYQHGLHCPGMKATDFVYLPFVADMAGFFTALLGQDGFRTLYIALYLAALAVLAHAMLLDRTAPGGWRQRLPFMALVTGSAVAWGNVAVVLHGLVAAAARLTARAPLVTALAIAAAAAIKPVFLLYLTVFAYSDRPLWKRAAWCVLSAALGLAPFAWFATQGGALAEQWRALLEMHVFEVTPGETFFGWLSLFGVDSRAPGALAGYVIYAAVLAFAGLAIADGAKLSPAHRMWLGLGVAPLLIPRLMSQDMFLIGPGMLVVLYAAGELSENARKWARRAIFGGCIAALVLNLADGGDYAMKLAILAYASALVGVGGAYAQRLWRTRRPTSLTPTSEPSV